MNFNKRFVEVQTLLPKIKKLLYILLPEWRGEKKIPFIVAQRIEKIIKEKRKKRLIGRSKCFYKMIYDSLNIAPTSQNVLLQGDSGTGKESIARITHDNSSRRHKIFLPVNCGAIPEGTVDAAFFGHEKGSFTGATESKKGYFETVNGGTLFLDEIGKMSLRAQSRLLRVLEEKEFMVVGTSRTKKVDFRLISATNLSLQEEIEKNEFRLDVFYRIAQFSINLPNLQEREQDILLMFHQFALDFADQYCIDPIVLSEEAKNYLLSRPLQGNIRELRNIVSQITICELEGTRLSIEQLKRYLPKRKVALYSNLIAGEKDKYNFLFLQREINSIRKKIDIWKKEQPEEKKKETVHNQLLPIMKKIEKVLKRVLLEEEKEEDSKNSVLPLMKEIEAIIIQEIIVWFKGDKNMVAKKLKVNLRSLYRRIKELDINHDIS